MKPYPGNTSDQPRICKDKIVSVTSTKRGSVCGCTTARNENSFHSAISTKIVQKNKFARNQCTPLAPTLYPFNDNCAQTIYLPQVKSSTRRTRVCAGTTARNQNSFHSAISTKIVYTNLWAQPMQFLGATASGYGSQCNSLLQLSSLVIHLLKKKK